MATDSTDLGRLKSKKGVLQFFILLDLSLSGFGFAHSNGRIMNLIAWLSGAQLAVVLFGVGLAWLMHLKPAQTPKQSSRRLILMLIGLVAISSFFIAWGEGIAPGIYNLALKNHGTTTTAQIIGYHIVNATSSSRGNEIDINTTASEANRVILKIHYADREETIDVDKVNVDRPNQSKFKDFIAQIQHGSVAVRYLSWASYIVKTQAELAP